MDSAIRISNNWRLDEILEQQCAIQIKPLWQQSLFTLCFSLFCDVIFFCFFNYVMSLALIVSLSTEAEMNEWKNVRLN